MSEIGKKKILIVEDGPDYQMIIQAALSEDYDLTMVSTGAEAYSAIENDNYDLILLDIILPDQDGYQICSHLRGRDDTKNTPIIFVTTKETVPDKVMGFSLGADDYVTKPFNTLELKARISAKMRVSGAKEKNQTVIERGQINIDVPCQRVQIQTGAESEPKVIDLTSTEFKLLLFLANHVDHVLNREQILDAVWGDSLNVTERTVDTHISKLRKKLEDCGNYIDSVHGSGYRFIVKQHSSHKVA